MVSSIFLIPFSFGKSSIVKVSTINKDMSLKKIAFKAFSSNDLILKKLIPE
jgi:hypothetical protein